MTASTLLVGGGGFSRTFRRPHDPSIAGAKETETRASFHRVQCWRIAFAASLITRLARQSESAARVALQIANQTGDQHQPLNCVPPGELRA